jgi:putative ABC transport system permease protein
VRFSASSNAVLLKPLPYSEPEQLYSAEVVLPKRDQAANAPVRIQDYLEWRNADTVFSAMAGLSPAEWNLTGDGEPERVGGARVSANFFSFLGVPLSYGRGFTPDEEQPGRDTVVVISEALWRRRYGSDPALLGRSIRLNGETHLLVGIAAPSLLFPTGTLLHSVLPFAPRIDVWKPLAPTKSELEGESWDRGLLARLKPGESAERGRQQLQTMLNRSIRTQVPDLKTDLIVQLVPIREIYAGRVRLRLLLVLAASALLLSIACTNIANLFLARVASRASEFAIRIALGAGRARIVGQTLTESTALAILGGGVGAAIANYGTGVLSVYGPDDVRLLADAHLNLPVLLFATLASLITGTLCGVFPAWQAYRKDAIAGMQQGVRIAFGGNQAARFRQLLVGIEMALGTALLASAGLLLHSFVNVMRADRGYQVEHALAVDLAPFGKRYSTGSQRAAFYRQLAGSIRALPGVFAAGAISELPAAAGISGTNQTIFHSTDTNFLSVVLQRPVALIRSATAGYFAASGTVLRAGRFFTEQDQIPIALISESLASRLWPGEALQSVVGRAFRQGDVTGPLITIAGIVEDVRPAAVDRELPPQIYRPHHQRATGRMTMVVRTSQEPAALAGIRAEIRKADPTLPIPTIRTMREIVSEAVSQRRFQMMLTSLFALVALLLAAVGVYGVVSYSVACRTRDIGLRIALGAMRRDILSWVFSNGMRPVLIGLAIGLAAAIMIARALRSLLFGISATDFISLGTVALVLLLTSALACYLPARSAAQLDPMAALRHE